ncbi:hypothetical protein HUG17_6643 [Dermatophagoides farinae]|uniref:Uncharacterized protein n=1 Tax=Dermatophagoides farinae TaxID=6954 RepID=A0A9D4P4V9_DERFA|nr:hypothetical protein HUG17_6643 [Dermatophagoides farinae]
MSSPSANRLLTTLDRIEKCLIKFFESSGDNEYSELIKEYQQQHHLMITNQPSIMDNNEHSLNGRCQEILSELELIENRYIEIDDATSSIDHEYDERIDNECQQLNKTLTHKNQPITMESSTQTSYTDGVQIILSKLTN